MLFHFVFAVRVDKQLFLNTNLNSQTLNLVKYHTKLMNNKFHSSITRQR